MSSLVPLAEHPTGTPLFLVPSAGSTPMALRRLARALTPARPVYSFMFAGLEDDKSPPTTIAEMAEAHVDEILTIQPDGPFLLGGHCFGAYPALEMTTVLKQRGFQSALLVLLETITPPYSEEILADREASRRIQNSDIHEDTLTAVDDLITQIDEQLQLLPAHRLEHFRQFTFHHIDLSREYRAPRTATPIVQFRTANHPDDVFHGWHHVTTRGYMERLIPGDAYSMLKPPHVESLARELGEILDRFS